MTYKPEIDGLRAFALVLVLMTHMQLGNITGGYIGVDAFFVISGYLITGIILSAVEKGKFGFWNFFGRRLVRLYPALLVTMVVIMGIAFFLVAPSYYEMMARSGKYALASAANIYFNKHLGYFDVAAGGQPLLHTWSLGIEWQFYLIWPFIVWGAMKVSRTFLIGVLIAITLASLFASQWAVHNDINAAYYLMPYRAFELSIGALLVFVYHKKPSPAVGSALMFGGILALLFISFYAYTPQTLFPGFAGLFPCMAAVVIIYGGQSFNKGNFLRFKPVVYLGKISYSVYLYHWPLLLLYGYYVFRDLTQTERIMMVFVSILVGAISYELIEKRINWRSFKNKRFGSIVIIILIALTIGACQYISRDGKGLPWRMQNNELMAPEFRIWGGEHLENQLQLIGNKDQKPFAIFAGDSLTGNIAIGLHEAILKENRSAQLAFSPGCIVSEIDYRTTTTTICRTVSKAIFQVADETKLPLVLTQAWWSPSGSAAPNADGTAADTTKEKAGDHDFIMANLAQIRQRDPQQIIILVGGVPFIDAKDSPRGCLLRPNFLPFTCKQELKDYKIEESRNYALNEDIKEFASTHPNTYYIDINPVLCPDGLCVAQEHAKIYTDLIHLSVYGSRMVANHVLAEVNQILKKAEETTP